MVLTGTAVIAGDYEVSLPGVYGDDLPLAESNRELVPLLQRLIKLLQEGTPEMLNTAGQVVSGGYTVVDGVPYSQGPVPSGVASHPVTTVVTGGNLPLTGKETVVVFLRPRV